MIDRNWVLDGNSDEVFFISLLLHLGVLTVRVFLVVSGNEELVAANVLRPLAVMANGKELRQCEFLLQVEVTEPIGAAVGWLLIFLVHSYAQVCLRDFELSKGAVKDHVIDLPVALEGVNRRRAVEAVKVQQAVIAIRRAHLMVETAVLAISDFAVYLQLQLHERFRFCAEAADVDSHIRNRWVFVFSQVLRDEVELAPA